MSEVDTGPCQDDDGQGADPAPHFTPMGVGVILAAASMPVGVFFLYSSQPFVLFLALYINLFALSVYDLRSYRLPNLLNFTFFVLAVATAYLQPRYSVSWHIIGSLVGFSFPVLLNYLYVRLRGRDGIGMGDAKLLAGAGMLLGWPELPLILSISSTLGLAVALFKMRNNCGRKQPIYIPFGPFIAFATLVVWLLY